MTETWKSENIYCWRWPSFISTKSCKMFLTKQKDLYIYLITKQTALDILRKFIIQNSTWVPCWWHCHVAGLQYVEEPRTRPLFPHRRPRPVSPGYPTSEFQEKLLQKLYLQNSCPAGFEYINEECKGMGLLTLGKANICVL